jgi:hypothetical protein
MKISNCIHDAPSGAVSSYGVQSNAAVCFVAPQLEDAGGYNSDLEILERF